MRHRHLRVPFVEELVPTRHAFVFDKPKEHNLLILVRNLLPA
jgi:hypothetical protein